MAQTAKEMKAIVFGDLIADVNMRLQQFPVQAKDLHRLSSFEIGPGGACNVAIMAARFGVPVSPLGEVGADSMGQLIRRGLEREGIITEHLLVSEGASTPVAGVMVDKDGEPGYLGYPGQLTVDVIPAAWVAEIESASIFFADGWAETPTAAALVLQGLEIASKAGAVTLFDPGPGNPDAAMQDNAWWSEAIAQSQVILLNRDEAKRITGKSDDQQIVALQARGPKYVVLKRGKDGLLIAEGEQLAEAAGIPVRVVDKTGAGDSVTGAIIHGLLNKIPLDKLAVLANAAGAAKVMKAGTGHNLPTLGEIAALLQANGFAPSEFLPPR